MALRGYTECVGEDRFSKFWKTKRPATTQKSAGPSMWDPIVLLGSQQNFRIHSFWLQNT
jgi:hypothetical protein